MNSTQGGFRLFDLEISTLTYVGYEPLILSANSCHRHAHNKAKKV